MKDSHSTGFILPVERKQPGVRVGIGLITLLMIALSLVFLVPLLWIILSSFKDTQEFLSNTPTFLPDHIELAKIGRVWEKSPLGKAYFWTVVMVVGDLFFMLVFNGLAGFVLSRLKPKGIHLVFALVMWTMMMPNNLGMVPRYIFWVKLPPINGFFNLFGLDLGLTTLNTYWSMWIGAGCSCFNCILFKGFFDGISNSYIEAARIDGCSEIGIFGRIIMPLSRPVMMTVAIFTITASWGNFMWPYIMIKDSSKVPIGVAIFSLSRNAEISADEYLMMLTFVIIPPLIFFLVFQKYIMQGMNLGGIKG